MGRRWLPLALVVLALGACGDDDSSSGTDGGTTASDTATESSTGSAGETTTAPAGEQAAPTEAADATKGVEVELGSPDDVPRSKGGDNSIQDFGEEASDADKAAAGRALVAFLQAYLKPNGQAACALLATMPREFLEQSADSSCEKAVQKLGGAVDPALHPEIVPGEVLSLRVDGERGFVIYRTESGEFYAMPVVKQGDQWLMGGVAGTPLSL